MLSLLHIENIAVIECADISFDRGFNVLTGETGAGKSIVIDAISAILGQRAYRDMIRTGTTRATVRAVFTDVPELSWFAEQGVAYDPETVIHREIHLDGKNVCRVNGTLVSVSILHKLGIQLINIHGQHDSAALFDEENHLTFLDAFADNRQLHENYQAAFAVVSQLRREISKLSMDEPFRQRIVMNYNLEGMSKAEGHSYVASKLKGAGCSQTVFEENALESILNAANGTPRMINKLCNASLLIGNSSNLNIITTDAVMQAINDCELG